MGIIFEWWYILLGLLQNVEAGKVTNKKNSSHKLEKDDFWLLTNMTDEACVRCVN